MQDFLHPTLESYEIRADAILPSVKQMLGAK
jgi:hypothetical protein